MEKRKRTCEECPSLLIPRQKRFCSMKCYHSYLRLVALGRILLRLERSGE